MGDQGVGAVAVNTTGQIASPQGGGDEGLALEIHPPAGRGAGIERSSDIDGAGGVVAAERLGDQSAAGGERRFAASASASIKRGGKTLFRFSARRMIPAHAFALKKYLDGIGPVSSTCDNEHTTAALGQAEILGVEHPPRDCPRGSKHSTSVRPFAPWRDDRTIFSGQSAQKASEGVVAGGEDSGDVLPNNPSWVDGIGEFHEFERKVATGIVQRLAQPRHRECLAGRAAHQDVDFSPPCRTVDGGHVAQIGDGRIAVGQHGGRKRLDLGEEGRPPTQRFPSYRRRFDSAAHGAVNQPLGVWHRAARRGYRLGVSKLHDRCRGTGGTGAVAGSPATGGATTWPESSKGALSLDKRAFRGGNWYGVVALIFLLSLAKFGADAPRIAEGAGEEPILHGTVFYSCARSGRRII
ncbi:conserved hypothetical protein [Magnetospirillum sp. SS-4]|nr:conserved hypothetical protein [Magnetospirillum sp. SS-4]